MGKSPRKSLMLYTGSLLFEEEASRAFCLFVFVFRTESDGAQACLELTK